MKETYQEIRASIIDEWKEARGKNRVILQRLENITLSLVDEVEERREEEGPLKIDAGTRDLIYKFFGLTNKVAVDQIKADKELLSLIQDDAPEGDSDKIKRLGALFTDQLEFMERTPAENRSEPKMRALLKASELFDRWDKVQSIVRRISGKAEEDGKAVVDLETVQEIREQLGL
jgi:hypothetical protein